MFDLSNKNQPGGTPRDSRGQEREIAQLQGEVERLLLITEALWKILKEKADLTDDDLVKTISSIDLEDGIADFRKKPTAPRKCPKCDRVLAKRRAQCMVCGHPVTIEPFER